jgi:glycine C-acetyltransferase
MDVFEKVIQNMGPIGQHMEWAHHYYAFPRLTGELGPYMTFNGKRMLNWSLNNYLGLANHPEVRLSLPDGCPNDVVQLRFARAI